MKAFGCIIISALAIYTLVPALGYEVQPLYGNANLLFAPQKLSPFVGLSSQLTALQTLVTSLQTQITALQNAMPKCPAAALAAGGMIVNGRCYTVPTNAAGVTFTAAQATCALGGGSLAEPPTTVAGSTSFYAALKAKFPAQFATIEATADKTIWIGYIQNAPGAANSLIAPLSGNSAALAPLQAAIFGVPPVVISPNTLAAALKGILGDIWAAIDSTTPAATAPKAYVCQFNTV